jgi:predicted ATPase/DNA-binding CsgD family transcriptional regulator
MAQAVARHYELLDTAIAAHGGVRPVEQGEGDSVVGAFSRASDAVAAAIDVQRAFARECWPDGVTLRVRIAVHTGEARLRDAGNYVGETLNRAARIRSAGHGGQVLLSGATAELTIDRLPAGVALNDLGRHRLKDLARPEHIWQALHTELESEFPPLQTLDMFRHNLPMQLSPLIGRTNEIAEVQRLLGRDKLVSLTGSAGVGKSRLALAVAAELLDSNPGGVWWVELAPVTDPDAVGRAALAAIGAPDAPDFASVRQLAAHLGAEPSALVLDNCEHLVAGCAAMAAGLLAANPSTRVLTTTREALGVPGEVTFRVPSLPSPPPERAIDVPKLSQYDAVVLFAERARRARPSFVVTDANCAAIAEICHRLDGIPLALELAAARCRQMSAEHIASELDDRFRLLTGGARTVMPRQQTLAASIDWSYDRLDDKEQRTFRRLGVFSGHFPLAAAEAIVGTNGDPAPVEVFDLLSRLVDKNLVGVEENRRSEARYRLLESLRAYALERVRSAGELSMIRDAHVAWWAQWLAPRGAMPTDDVLEEMAEFHDNIRSALNWAVDRPRLGLPILRDVAKAWDLLGRAGDAMTAIDELLTDDNAAHYGPLWLSAAHDCGHLIWLARGPVESSLFRDRVESAALRLGDNYHLAVERWLNEAPRTASAVRELARERGDRHVELDATIYLASELASGEPAAAGPLLRESRIRAESSGSSDLRMKARMAHAEAAASTGDLAQSIELALGVLQARWGPWPAAVRVLGFAGLLARSEPALRQAVDFGDRALGGSPGTQGWIDTARHRSQLLDGHASAVDPLLHVDASAPRISPGTLWLLGREAIDANAGEAAVNWSRVHADPSPHGQAVLAAIEAAAGDNENRWHDALTTGLAQGLRLISVDALEGLAVSAAIHESWAECLRLIAAAGRLRDDTGYQWRFPFEQRAVELARASATEALGDSAVGAITEGGTLDWRDAAAYVRRSRGKRKRPRHGWASLTPTEQRVVALVAEGLSNPQIASRLYVERTTVKTHLEHVFTKLGVSSRSELAAEAARHNP